MADKELSVRLQVESSGAEKVTQLDRAIESVGNSGVETAAKANQLAQADNRVAASADKAADQVRDLAAAENQAATSANRANQETQKLAQSVRKTGDEASTAGGKLGEMKTIVEAIAGAAMAKRFVDANVAADGFARSMELVTGSTEGAAREIDYVTKLAERLGLPIRDVQRAWLDFSAAVKGSALEGEPARAVFESVSAAMSKLGKSADETQGALLALQQMVSKGVVSSEELKNQLGERLPGAFQLASKAMGVSTEELGKMLENGEIMASDLLPRLATELNKTFGDPNDRVETLSATLGRFQTAIDSALVSLGKAGVVDGFSEGVAVLASTIVGASEAIRLLGVTIGISVAAGVEQFHNLAEAAEALVKLDFSGVDKAIDKVVASAANAREEFMVAFDAAAKRIEETNQNSKLLSGTLGEVGEQAKSTGEKVAGVGTAAQGAAVDIANLGATAAKSLAADSAEGLYKALLKVGETGTETVQGFAAMEAALKKLSGQELAWLQAQLQANYEKTGQFNTALQAVANEGLRRLGLDANEVFGGISTKAQEAIQAFDLLRESGRLSGEQIYKAFEGALAIADTEKAVEALRVRLEDLGKQGELTKPQLEELFAKVKEQADEATKGINSLDEALKTFGIQTQAEAKAIADKFSEAWSRIKNDGTVTLEQKRTAFIQYANAAIAANRGVADSLIQSQAEMLGLELKADSTGRTIVARMNEAANATGKIAGEAENAVYMLGEMADAADQAAEKAQGAAEKMREASKEGGRRGGRGNNEFERQAGALNYIGIINYLKSAGLNDQTAQRIAEEFVDDQGNVPFFSNPGQLKYGGKGSTLTDALGKAAVQERRKGGSSTTDTGNAGKQQPDHTSLQPVTINIGGQSHQLNLADRSGVSTLETVLRELAQGKSRS